MQHNLVNPEEMDEEMEGILALFRDQHVEDFESIESAPTSRTTSRASTSSETAEKLTEDATMDLKALPTVPDIDDQAYSAISGTSGVSGGVVTGSNSVEVDKLTPISAPVIISTTSVVSWAEYRPTSTDELLTIPDIDQHSPTPISEAPKPPLTTLWLQPFLHDGAMEAHRIYQEEIVGRGFQGTDSKWSTITHAERFENKPIDLKEDASRSDGIATFIPVNSVQEDDTSNSSSSSITSVISDDDAHNSIPWSNAINCSYSQHMSIAGPIVLLDIIWPHASSSENKRMRGANLTEGELYCTENINTSVLSVGEDHRRPSNTSSAIITDTRSFANSGNQADDHIRQGIITCSTSATPSCGHDLHENSSPESKKRSYSRIMSSSSAMIPEALSSFSLPASSPSENVRMRGENSNTAHRPPRDSRQSISQGISSQYAPVMSISISSMVSLGEPSATPPTPENIWWSMRGTNAPTPDKRMCWTLDIRHGLVKKNPDAVNNVQVCNTLTSIEEAEPNRRRSIRGKGLEFYNRPMFDPSTIQAEDMRRRSIRGEGLGIYNRPMFDPSTIQAEDMRRRSVHGEGLGVYNPPMFDPSTIQAEDMRRRSIRGEGLGIYNRPMFDPSTIQAEDMRRRSVHGEGLGVYNPPMFDPSTIQAEDMRRRSIRGEGLGIYNRPMSDPSTIQAEDMRRRSIRGEGLGVYNGPMFDPSTIQAEDMRRRPIRGEGLGIYNRPMFDPLTIQAEDMRRRSVHGEGLGVYNGPMFDPSTIQVEDMRRRSIRGEGIYNRPMFDPSTIQAGIMRRRSVHGEGLGVYNGPMFDPSTIRAEDMRRRSILGEGLGIYNGPMFDPSTIQAEDMRRRSFHGEGLGVYNRPVFDPSTIRAEDMRRRSVRGEALEIYNRPMFDHSTIQAEDMGRRPIRGEGLGVHNRPVFNPSAIQAEISQRWIQQHHKSEVDTSVFQFSPQEEAFAHQNFPPKAVGHNDQPERFTFPQSENELAAVFGMPKSQHGRVEMLMSDLMGLGWGGVGAGEGELAFNNSEFFEVTPPSEANNLSEEITTVTQPQLNSSGSDNSQR